LDLPQNFIGLNVEAKTTVILDEIVFNLSVLEFAMAI
jgi:hypothetical protein